MGKEINVDNNGQYYKNEETLDLTLFEVFYVGIKRGVGSERKKNNDEI